MRALSLTALGCRIEIRCADPPTRGLLQAVYAGLLGPGAPAHGRYTVRRGDGFLIERDGGPPARVADEGDLLVALDREIVVELQRRRPDLYFLHAAVLARGGPAVLLVAPSGTGKSTTAWALSHRGFRYLSDELAPIDPGRGDVHAFPRALCLKGEPPADYPLPAGIRRAGRTLHVPAGALPGGSERGPLPVGAIVFLHRPAAAPAIHRVGPAEGAARLLANALNPLAHPAAGLDAAIAIARRAPCFALVAADLRATCRLLAATLDALAPPLPGPSPPAAAGSWRSGSR